MSIVSYQGSKRKELDFINKWEPTEFQTVVDVFGGGANVSMFYLNRNINTIYNDINSDMVQLLKVLRSKKNTAQLIIDYNKLRLNNSIELFYKIFDNLIDMTPECRFVYLCSNCFLGCFTKRTPKTLHKKLIQCKKIEYFEKFESKLINLENIFNEDYKIILDKYRDMQDHFLYLDPPYLDNTSRAYNVTFTIADLEYIKSFMATCKCKVMLHLEFTGWTYYTFKKMIRETYPVHYNMTGKTKIQTLYNKYHCIITNYVNELSPDVKKL